MQRMVSKLRFRIKKIRVYALVGASGTGKSFRAMLLREKHKIDLIIDDGLLIRGQRILAGRSAKRETSRVAAIKRAIFFDSSHALEIKRVLEREKFRSILILGISDKMIDRIVNRLGLPEPETVIRIEDIATEEEIAHAQDSRRTKRKHVIPVPQIEVRQDPAHRILGSINLFLERHPLIFWKKNRIEKTVVQPPFSRKGRLRISESALSQMIMHCVAEYAAEVSIRKIIINPSPNGYDLELSLALPFGIELPHTLGELQAYIRNNVERYSGIHINTLDVTVDQVH